MRILERDMSKRWIERHVKMHKNDYPFRIHDCPYERKPFDYLLFCGEVTWAIEFKVDRRKKFRYKIEELPLHQDRELRLFSNGKSRRSKVVVYHVHSNEWHEMEVS